MDFTLTLEDAGKLAELIRWAEKQPNCPVSLGDLVEIAEDYEAL